MFFVLDLYTMGVWNMNWENSIAVLLGSSFRTDMGNKYNCTSEICVMLFCLVLCLGVVYLRCGSSMR